MIMTMLWILLYAVPFGLITLNSAMECANSYRAKESIDGSILFLLTFISLVPMLNFIVIMVFIFIERDEIFILNYHKRLNESLQCVGCKIATRVHYLGNVVIKGMWYGRVVRYEDKCPFCDRCGSMVYNEELDDKEIPFGKKISLLGSVKHFFSQRLDSTERKLVEIHNKQRELEFVDSQLEIYIKLQESKLEKYMSHAEKVKNKMTNKSN